MHFLMSSSQVKKAVMQWKPKLLFQAELVR